MQRLFGEAHAWVNFELIVRLCLWTFECVNLRQGIVWGLRGIVGGGGTVLVMQGMRDPTLSSNPTSLSHSFRNVV